MASPYGELLHVLAIQIAAGIVLAAVVLRFWRELLRWGWWGFLVLLGLLALLLVVNWLDTSPTGRWIGNAFFIGLAVAYWGYLVYAAIRERRRARRP